jgi:polysaccharide deacetylase family protein (PEP-CTERM system associated)
MAPEAIGSRVPNALSIDVEDYFHVEAFADCVKPSAWQNYPSRVVQNTHRLLELFARNDVRGTFFVLGWVAERHPALVREIVSSGHELACHSYAHRALWRISPEEFHDDTARAISTLEDASGTRIFGYRAPTFSITSKTLWALPILKQLGFEYDSSVYPIRHDYYGIPDAPRQLFQWQLEDGQLLDELPGTTVRVRNRNLPVGGGGYLRILPSWYTGWGLKRLDAEGLPAMLYLHPWEVDPEQPRIAGRIKSRIRHYTNLRSTERKLEGLLRTRRWAPVREVIQQIKKSGVKLPKLEVERGQAHNSRLAIRN